MIININNEQVEVEPGIALQTILEQKNFAEKKGIAVALNSSVVPKAKWNEITLNENDKVLIISATKGG